MFKGLQKLINSNGGKYLISIILGLGLATIFRKVCKDRNCLKFQGAPLNKITNQIFKFDNKCYKFSSNIKKCDNNKKIVDFA